MPVITVEEEVLGLRGVKVPPKKDVFRIVVRESVMADLAVVDVIV